MGLISNIRKKARVVFSAAAAFFISTAAFAQTAAAGANAKADKLDMGAVWKSVAFYSLGFLAFCLFVAIVGKALRIYELSRELQGKKGGINWHRFNATAFFVILIVGLYGAYWEYTVHGAMILPEAASEHGKRIDTMFNITLIITTIVFVLTHIGLFVFAFIYRKSDKRKAYFYPHNNAIEVIWTVTPAIVLAVLVLFGFLTWRSIFFKTPDPKNKPIEIEVLSQQFAWFIRYSGPDGIVGRRNYKMTTGINPQGIDFTDLKSRDDLMADELVLPVNRPVRLRLTSKDVIHSFYLPHFRVQMNTVPGMNSYFEFTPTITTKEMQEKTGDPNFKYLFLCSKICGEGHYNMQKDVRIVSEKEYQEWLAAQKPYLNDNLRKAFNMPAAPAAAPAEPAKADSNKGPELPKQKPTVSADVNRVAAL